MKHLKKSVLLIFTICVFMQIHAQNTIGGIITGREPIKRNELQVKLKKKDLHAAWQNIHSMVVQHVDIPTITQACRQLICSTTFTDSLAYNARTLLAEIYMKRINRMDINTALQGSYEQMVYFKKYSEVFPGHNSSRKMYERLNEYYFGLVAEDMQNIYPFGVYFSDVFDGFFNPILIGEFSKDNNQQLQFTLLPSCRISSEAKAYGSLFKQSTNEFANTILVEIDGLDNSYMVAYNAEKLRRGNTRIAQIAATNASTVRTTTSSYDAIGQTSFSDKMASGILSGAFDSWAKSLAANKTTSTAAVIKFETDKSDSIGAYVCFYKNVQRDGEPPEIIEYEQTFKLHKMYPHYEMLFFNIDDGCSTFSRGSVRAITFDEWDSRFLIDDHYATYSVLNADFAKDKTTKFLKSRDIVSIANFLLNRVFTNLDELNILPKGHGQIEWYSYSSTLTDRKFSNEFQGFNDEYSKLNDTCHLLRGKFKCNGDKYFIYLRQSTAGDLYYSIKTKRDTKTIHCKIDGTILE